MSDTIGFPTRRGRGRGNMPTVSNRKPVVGKDLGVTIKNAARAAQSSARGMPKKPEPKKEELDKIPRLSRSEIKSSNELQELMSLDFPDLYITEIVTRILTAEDIGKKQPNTLYKCVLKSGTNNIFGTPNDPNMGASSRYDACLTCQSKNCVGHPGYIEFKKPIPHPYFIRKILGILKVTCSDCSRLLIGDETIMERLKSLPNKDRLMFLENTVGKGGGTACPHKISAPSKNFTPYVPKIQSEMTPLGLYINVPPSGNYVKSNLKFMAPQQNLEFNLDVRITPPTNPEDIFPIQFFGSHGDFQFLTYFSINGIPVQLYARIASDAELPFMDRVMFNVSYFLFMNNDYVRLQFFAEIQDPKFESSEEYQLDVMSYTQGYDVIPGLLYQGTYQEKITGSKAMPKVCGPPRNYFIKESKTNGSIYYSYDNKNKNNKDTISIDQIENILNGISEEDYALLGFEKSSVIGGYILKGMAVTPPSCRPAYKYQGLEEPKEHHLTDLTVAIVNANEKLGTAISEGSSNINELHRQLFIQYDNYFEAIKQILNGKEGYVRKYLFGKRANFTGRAVVGPASAETPWNWIEIPEKFALRLRVEELVTPENIKAAEILVRAGEVPLIRQVNGSVRLITAQNMKTIKIRAGDILERKLRDGDLIVLNRQPTIQIQSITAHRVKIVKDRYTIGVPLLDTPHFGMDFDGDEGNLHLGQSKEARREMLELMDVRKHLISVQSSTPITGLVLNSITLAYLLTERDVRIRSRDFTNVIIKLRRRDQMADFSKRLSYTKLHPYSGKSLFSTLFPSDFQYDNNGVKIVDGIMIEGRISADVVGANKMKSIHHMIEHIYGYIRAAEFLSDATLLMDSWNDIYGFSLTLDDLAYANDPAVLQMLKDYYEFANKQMAELGENPSEIDITNITMKSENLVQDIMDADNKKRREMYEEKIAGIAGYVENGQWVKRSRLQNLELGIQRFLSEIGAEDNLEIKHNLELLIFPLRDERFALIFSASMKRSLYRDILRLLKVGEINLDVIQNNLAGILSDDIKIQNFQRKLYDLVGDIADKYIGAAELIGKSLKNALGTMGKDEAAAKGSRGNSSQIFGTISLQTTSEGLLAQTIPGKRIFTAFAPEDPTLLARGFCPSNFFKGLQPEEYQIAAMAGREPQTTINTQLPVMGRIRRQVAKTFENVKKGETCVIDYSDESVIEIIYGGDNFHPNSLLKVQDKMTFIDIKSFIMQLNSEAGWIPDIVPEGYDYSDEHNIFPEITLPQREPDVFDKDPFDIMSVLTDPEFASYRTVGNYVSESNPGTTVVVDA